MNFKDLKECPFCGSNRYNHNGIRFFWGCLGQALVNMGYNTICLSKEHIELMLFVSEKEHIIYTISIEQKNNRLLLSEGALFERWNNITNGVFCLSEIDCCDYDNTEQLINQFKDSIDFLIQESKDFLLEDNEVEDSEMKSGIVIEEANTAIEKFASDNQYTVIDCKDIRDYGQ